LQKAETFWPQNKNIAYISALYLSNKIVIKTETELIMGLSVKNVTKRFGQHTVVDGVSFALEEPGVFGLLGTNGAGKTTTIRMILGILEKDGGSIEWNGGAVTREGVRFGYLPEERGLYPKIKVGEQLMYFAGLRGMNRHQTQEVLHYWYDRLDVAKYANMPAEQLSKGNQQKIQLITAILHDPDLLILDEPLSGLDPVNAELFKEVINELVQKGKYVVMSSHQMASVEEYCRDILILVDGKTVLSGNLKAIKRGYGKNNLYIGCEEDITADAQALQIALLSKTAEGFEFKITSPESAYAFVSALLAKRVQIDKFEIREPSLNEIFIEKAGERK
jgi:ABC-2 type transport system ATP-binding protein